MTGAAPSLPQAAQMTAAPRPPPGLAQLGCDYRSNLQQRLRTCCRGGLREAENGNQEPSKQARPRRRPPAPQRSASSEAPPDGSSLTAAHTPAEQQDPPSRSQAKDGASSCGVT